MTLVSLFLGGYTTPLKSNQKAGMILGEAHQKKTAWNIV